METAYAQALWKMIDKGMQPAKAVEALHKVLVARGRATLMPRIAKAFERIFAREMSRSGMTLTVAHHKDEHHAKAASRKALEAMKVEWPKHLHVKVDDSLIGGWRIEGAGELIDASFKKQLLEIYSKATAA